MKLNLKGITRIVIEFDNVVIKIPNFRYQWNHFLKGLLANMQEHNMWKWYSDKELGKYLCPVIWSSWGGWLLIMKRADKPDVDLYKKSIIKFKKLGLGSDVKIENYGMIYNKIVKVDYGS